MQVTPDETDVSTNEVSSSQPPSGIGGWLILPAIGLVITPVSLVLGLRDYPQFFRLAEPWTALYTVAIVDVLSTVLLIGLALVAALAFFAKRRIAPKLFIGLQLAILAWSVVVIVVLEPLSGIDLVQQEIRVLARTALSAAIWVPYFLVSKRVKATFTH